MLTIEALVSEIPEKAKDVPAAGAGSLSEILCGGHNMRSGDAPETEIVDV